MSKDLSDAIKILSGYTGEFESMVGTVSNISLTDFTCDVEPLNGGAKFLNVPLSVNGSKGFLLVPANDSKVIITKTSKANAFISMVSDVQQVYINGDNKGGLVNVEDAVSRYNLIENKINLILTFLAGIGGAPPLTTPLVTTVRANIENIKVLHGS